MRSYGVTNAAPYTSAPPVGVSGDTYWDTTARALYVSDGTAWNQIGPGAGGPPTGTVPAGGDLTGSYPAPTLVPAQKNLWQVSGTALTPLDTTKNIAFPGDPTKFPAIVLGTQTSKSRIQSANTVPAAALGLSTNRDWTGNTQDDATKPSWQLQIRSDTDQINMQHNAPGAGITTPFYVNGPDGKTYCTLADKSVTGVMMAANSACRTGQWTPAPASYNTGGAGWKAFMTSTAVVWPGVVNLVLVGVAMYYVGAVGANEIYIAIYRDGAQLTPYLHWTVSFGSGGGIFQVPVPLHFATYDNSFSAGVAHNYAIQVYVANANGNLLTSSDAPGGFSVWSFS